MPWIRRLPPVASFLAGFVAFACACAAAPALGQGFQAVHSKNGQDVWAVGDAGAWSRSFDGGVTWTAGTLPTTRMLRGVAHRGLTVLVVADSGLVFRSVDNGVTWTSTVLAGTPDLAAVAMPSANVAVLVGAAETIRRSDDGGASWTPQGPAGASMLRGLRMLDDLTGWAVGNGGRVLSTVDGGANWLPVAVPTGLDLFAVDAAGSRIWVVGAGSLALKSTTGGAAWSAVNLRMELPGTLRGVSLSGASGVTLTGGGGFIRSSSDDGVTWSFASHPLIASTSAYFAFGANLAWVSANTTRAVARTTDGGTTWTMPSGTSTGWNWQLKRAAGNVIVRGNTFATTPQNRNAVWCVMGSQVYKSLDRGDSWALVGAIPGVIKTNSFYVDPRDSTRWVAACGTPDQVARTTDSGGLWTTTLTRDFSEYGMPLEMNPDRPDTLLLGAEDGRLYRSQDFGATWDTLSTPGFRSPCDIVISPDNDTFVVVGDGVTGVGLAKIFQSTDGGASFADRYTSTSSETPTVWSSRLANGTMFAANWSSGGVWRSLDYGQSWGQVTTVTSAWGGATATDDPKLVVFNRYAGSPNYVSTDGGTTFTSSTLVSPGSGYALHTLDRSTILDLHSGGIYKLLVSYTVPVSTAQSLALGAPDGGESWLAGSVRAITWTASNVALVAVEWRAHPGDAWTPVAQVEGSAGTYAWTVPAMPTTEAEVRVVDAADGAPADSSSAPFTILSPRLVVTPLAIAFGSHAAGSATLDSVRVENTGTALLTVSSISTATPAFHPGRGALTLAPGAADTVGVTFSPTLSGAFADTVRVTSDGGMAAVALSGTGTLADHVTLVRPNGGEAWQYGYAYDIEWQSSGVAAVALDYRVGEAESWIEIVASTPAAAGSYAWGIPLAVSSACRLRVRQVGGALSDISDGLFALTAPQFLATPAPQDFGLTPVGYATWDTLRIGNPGSGRLNVSNISSDNAAFKVTRTTMSVLAGATDTLAIWFTPLTAMADSALVTFTTDDAIGSHAVRVHGEGANALPVELGPLAYAIERARPNPFSGETSIRFALPVAGPVSLEVFDLAGRRVAVLAQGRHEAGLHAVSFRPRGGDGAVRDGLPSGVYFVRFTAGSFTRTQKLLYLVP